MDKSKKDMDIIIHNHYTDGPLSEETLRIVKENQESLIKIKNQILKIMANEQGFKDALARVEAATTAGGVAATAIQARIDALTEAIKSSGLSTEVEDALLAQIEGIAPNAEALAAALTAMGSVTEPIPVPVPEPLPPAA